MMLLLAKSKVKIQNEKDYSFTISPVEADL
jgi:hypothetical protein